MKQTQITKKSLYSWVFYKNTNLQILLCGIILVTVATRVFPLEMQKRIINQAIGLGQLDTLYLYCGLYLAAVVTAGILKYAINCLQTYIGQKTLITVREELFRHLLKLPLPFYRRTQPGYVISALVQELAAVASFVGAAVATPLVNILTLFAFAGYMFYLEPWLAALSLAIYPVEILVIPKLQMAANRANRERIQKSREASGHVGEAISGIHEVQSNASFNLEVNKFRKLILDLFKFNNRMNYYRYGVKFVNNFFQSLGPFILFLVGGYLAIKGRFDLGALVAFLSAYEKVYDPWKELMEFYQIYQDATVRYKQIMETFDIEPEFEVMPPEDEEIESLDGSIEVRDLYYTVSGGIKLLDNINLDVKPGEQLALVGFSGSGKSTLALCMAQLYKYSAGRIALGGKDVHGLPKASVAKTVGMVAQHPFIFNGTVKENLLYSCEAMVRQEKGTVTDEDLPDLDSIIEVVQQVGLFLDVLAFGQRTVMPKDSNPELVEKLIRVRLAFQEEFGEQLDHDVEFFDQDSYMNYSSVAVNLTFADHDDADKSHGSLYRDKEFLKFLGESNLVDPLIKLGRNLTIETCEALENLPRTPEIFEQSPIALDDFDDYLKLAGQLKSDSDGKPGSRQKEMLLKLALGCTPGVHTVVAIPVELKKAIVEARKAFSTKYADEEASGYHFYHLNEYIHSQTIQENIIFGRIKADSAGALERVSQAIMQLLIVENLLEEVVEMGLHFEVGSAGDRLSGGQRQKIALARAFLKEPEVFIFDEATAALDNASQARIQNLLDSKWKGRSTMVSVAHRLDIIKDYDKIAVLKAGKVLEMGTYDELMAKKGALHELVSGSRK